MLPYAGSDGGIDLYKHSNSVSLFLPGYDQIKERGVAVCYLVNHPVFAAIVGRHY